MSRGIRRAQRREAFYSREILISRRSREIFPRDDEDKQFPSESPENTILASSHPAKTTWLHFAGSLRHPFRLIYRQGQGEKWKGDGASEVNG